MKNIFSEYLAAFYIGKKNRYLLNTIKILIFPPYSWNKRDAAFLLYLIKCIVAL